MLLVDTHLILNNTVPEAANLTPRFSDDDLGRIGDWVWQGYVQDEGSRQDWLRRVNSAMDLALQLQKDKSFPWPNCSNVAFPLITIAALQFHARAYPALVSGTDIVKFRTPAADPSGDACLQAAKVGRYMSYQVLEEDQAWEEQHDRLLLQTPLVGCSFIKTWHSPSLGHNVSELVPATSLCVDYNAKSIEAAARKTQIIPFHRNEIHEKCLSGVWRDITDEGWYGNSTMPFVPPGVEDQDDRKGLTPAGPDEATPLVFLEQHCYADFDKDGYQEPYIITIEANTRTVVRIVARWERSEDVQRTPAGRVLRIATTEYYTKYGLIPSPDGSIYDMGFGILLGPLNESVNSLVNMLIDTGTMAAAAGGFLSRGVKMRGGAFVFNPFSWNRVETTGEDLAKGIFPLPVREPSAVLFTLLSFLVDYTQRISGSVDALAGENPGQNTPAETQRSMVEQGAKIYNSLFKRGWRSMKEEFRKLYVLNARHLPESKAFGSETVGRADFLDDPAKVCPAADPNVTSDQMKLQQALTIAARAGTVPGYDPAAVETYVLQAMKVDGVEKLYPGPQKMPPPTDPKLALEQFKAQAAAALDQAKGQREMQKFIAEMQEEMRVNDSEIANHEAQAALYAAQADGEAAGKQLAYFDAMIGASKARNERIQGHLDALLRVLELQHKKEELKVTKAQNAQTANSG